MEVNELREKLQDIRKEKIKLEQDYVSINKGNIIRVTTNARKDRPIQSTVYGKINRYKTDAPLLRNHTRYLSYFLLIYF